MEKLLHERLRHLWDDFADGFTPRIQANGKKIPLREDDAIALADEIERYYIPRPRFEDGEPIQKGDPFIQKFRDEEAVLSRIGIALYTDDGLNAVWFPDEVVPRPTPKAYDADGVEIKVGEKLYNPQGHIFEVRSIEGDEDEWLIWCGETKCGIKVCYRADECTYERPVFDAEGVRICKGDTVWHITRCEKHTVEKVDGEDCAIYINDCPMAFSGVEFTHREPDSQKLIDADAELSGKAYCRKHNLTPHEASCGKSTKYKHLFKRQRALIERGA